MRPVDNSVVGIVIDRQQASSVFFLEGRVDVRLCGRIICFVVHYTVEHQFSGLEVEVYYRDVD